MSVAAELEEARVAERPHEVGDGQRLAVVAGQVLTLPESLDGGHGLAFGEAATLDEFADPLLQPDGWQHDVRPGSDLGQEEPFLAGGVVPPSAPDPSHAAVGAEVVAHRLVGVFHGDVWPGHEPITAADRRVGQGELVQSPWVAARDSETAAHAGEDHRETP